MMSARSIADAIMEVMDIAFDPAFGEAWTHSQVLGALVMPETRALLIDEQGRLTPGGDAPVAGFALLRRALDEEELLLIAVAPALRGRGLARRLLDHVVATSRELGCTRIFLEMRDDNPARRLYQANGFSPVGLRREYYTGRDGMKRDAITFMRLI